MVRNCSVIYRYCQLFAEIGWPPWAGGTRDPKQMRNRHMGTDGNTVKGSYISTPIYSGNPTGDRERSKFVYKNCMFWLCARGKPHRLEIGSASGNLLALDSSCIFGGAHMSAVENPRPLEPNYELTGNSSNYIVTSFINWFLFGLTMNSQLDPLMHN